MFQSVVAQLAASLVASPLGKELTTRARRDVATQFQLLGSWTPVKRIHSSLRRYCLGSSWRTHSRWVPKPYTPPWLQ